MVIVTVTEVIMCVIVSMNNIVSMILYERMFPTSYCEASRHYIYSTAVIEALSVIGLSRCKNLSAAFDRLSYVSLRVTDVHYISFFVTITI